MLNRETGPMHKSIMPGMFCLAVLTIGSVASVGEPRVAGSASLKAAKSNMNHQRVLIGPMELGDNIDSGGWRMKNFLIKTAEGMQAKIGRSALVFGADAEIAGAKGDFSIHGRLPGKTDMLGLWVYLEEDSNIEKLGIQVYDAQSEALMMLIPADWSGWKWVEFATAGNRVQQAYPQPDKNGSIDQPLSSQKVVWFAKAPGATRMIVDGMVAVVDRSGLPDEEDLTVETFASDIVEPGWTILVSILAVNYTDKPIAVDLAYSFQRDSTLYSTPMPDPVFGSNHAPGLRNWIVADGEIIEDGSLTDGKPWTDAGTAYKTNHFTEAFQYVELDKVRRITKMT